MDNVKISSCPFCGGECEVTRGYTTIENWPYGDFWRVFCTECQTRQLFHKTSAEAISAWNRRPETEMRSAVAHKVTFGRNHNGEPLVLFGGKVQAVAKDCYGWDYVKAHCAAFDKTPITLSDNAAGAETQRRQDREYIDTIKKNVAQEMLICVPTWKRVLAVADRYVPRVVRSAQAEPKCDECGGSGVIRENFPDTQEDFTDDCFKCKGKGVI